MSCLILLVVLIALYYALPITFLIAPSTFVPFVYLYWFAGPYPVSNFGDFASFNITVAAARSFYLPSEFDNVSLGVWQILPNEENVTGPKPTDQEFLDKLKDRKPIILYNHGVGFHRAVPIRIETCKLISRLGYHVFALDYRGFGDSEGEPHGELDIVSDSITVLKYIRTHAPTSKIIVWGHSIGTGVTGSAYKKIQETTSSKYANGLFLDAAFDNIYNAAINFPITKVYSAIIGINSIIRKVLNSVNIHYATLLNLEKAVVPITIVFSEDDEVIPHIFSVDLYEGLRAAGVDVTFQNLGSHGYGHRFNYRSPLVPGLVRALVNKADYP